MHFLKSYGKHVLKIEVVLISVLVLAFTFPAVFNVVSTFYLAVWMVASIVGINVHLYIYLKIADNELHPYEVIFTGRFRSNLTLISYVSFLFWVLSAYVLSLFPPALQSGNILSDSLNYLLLILLPMFFVMAFLSLTSISNFRKARLSLVTVLDGLMQMSNEKEQRKKAKLAKKYLGWFKIGLTSYNGYLYKQPIHIKILNIDDYYHELCCAALLGNEEQATHLVEEVRSALNSLDGRGTTQLKNLLIALKRIRGRPKAKNIYRLSELSELIRITSLSDRIWERAKHPLFKYLLPLIIAPVISEVIKIPLRWLKLV